MKKPVKIFTLAGIRRLVEPVTTTGGHTSFLQDGSLIMGVCGAGLYCLVEWASSDKRSIRVRNMNSSSHAEPIAEALRAAGLKVTLVINPKSQLNSLTLLVTENEN